MLKNILKITLWCSLLCSFIFIVFSYASAADIRQRQVATWNELKWENIKRQQFDYSCGAAALSTLIEYYFNDPAPEGMLLTDMFERLNEKFQKDRRERGFSIQDLKLQAESMGYVAAGAKLTPEMLMSLKGPVIVLLEGEKINHFVVLKGIKDGKAFFADPQRGNIRYELRRFLPKWNGLALVLGKKGYGLPTDHLLKINESLTSQWVTSGTDAWHGAMHQIQYQPHVFSRMIFPLQPATE